MTKLNHDVDPVIDLYIETVAMADPYEPIRAVQVSLWASDVLEIEVPDATILNHLKKRANDGLLVMTKSHVAYLEYHFYVTGVNDERE